MGDASADLPVMCVVGARPNFMKIAPIMEAFAAANPLIPATLVHTGQHYDIEMNRTFFEQLGIPKPDVNLDVGSASHALQTAEIMRRLEPVIDEKGISAMLVVGDVNSTIAGALVAAKKDIPVIHVEAGLRSHDRTMPEEINRVLTDQISQLLFTTEREAEENLKHEGVDSSRVHFVGNVMIDTLMRNLGKTPAPDRILAPYAPGAGISDKYALLTLHRPSNVDDPIVLERLLRAIRTMSETVPVLFPVHPRTSAMIERARLREVITCDTMLLLPPLGYLEMLGLMAKAFVVLTDSGGIQEETTALGVPCLTLRNNTERPVTVAHGTNTIVGNSPERIAEVFRHVVGSGGKKGRIPELWDGRAAERIAATVNRWRSGS